MHFNFLGLIAAGLSVAAFAIVYGSLRSRKVPVRWSFFCLFALLSLPSVLFAVYYTHIVSEHGWFYTLRSWQGSEFLAVFLGCAAGAAASLLPRSLLILPLCAFIVLALIPYMKPILQPLSDSVFADRWRGDVCLQSTPSTCGPASVCTILKRLGSHSSERTVARAAFSSASGTEAWYLARYIRSEGFVVRFDFRETFSPAVGLPAVVGVRFGSVGHFIAVLGMDGDQITFADPLSGPERIPVSQFQKRYTFTGFHMVITKT